MKIRSITAILLCVALICVCFSACVMGSVDPATLQTAKSYRPGSFIIYDGGYTETPDELFVDGEINYSDEEFFNETSMVSRISANDPKKSGETLGMLFLGDAGKQVGERLSLYYGDRLRTDMVQISHHGVENFPLSTYQTICPSILFYPCNMALYNLTDRDAHVRQAMREAPSTKEILLRDNGLYTRYLNPDMNPG